jgi:hypothetical protein
MATKPNLGGSYMTKAEKLKALTEEYLKRFAEIEKECDTVEEKPEIAPIEYINKINNSRSYFLNQSCLIGHGSFEFTENEKNPYQYYVNQSLAKLAYANKKLNDMLLAYKAAYDLDYCPDWTNSHAQKHYVLYSVDEKKYSSSYCYTLAYPTVFFSSYRIAEECADWLNSLGITPDKLYHELDN